MIDYGFIGGILAISAVLVLVWAAKYTKCGPNELLIISGRKRRIRDKAETKTTGFRIIKGGGTFVWPIIEQVRKMSLELMNLEVRTQDVYSIHGVPITVEATAQIKIRGDEPSIIMAAEHFLSKSRDDILKTAYNVIEGHMRATISASVPEEIYQKRKEFAEKVKVASTCDLSRMGLEILSLTIRSITDSQGYLDSLGRPKIAQVKRDALIGEAIAEEEAKRVRYQADINIESAKRDYEVRKAELDAEIAQKKAASDLAYELQKFKTEQLVKEEEIRVGIVEKELMAALAEKEIARKRLELAAEIIEPAEAERIKTEKIAEADKIKMLREAEGKSVFIKSTGIAEADVIREKGRSEAETMEKKANAWRQYNEAAIASMLIQIMPELAEAVAAPLSKTDKVIIISNDGTTAGANKLTNDITRIISQLPVVVESLTGLKLEDMIKKLPALGGASSGLSTNPSKTRSDEVCSKSDFT